MRSKALFSATLRAAVRAQTFARPTLSRHVLAVVAPSRAAAARGLLLVAAFALLPGCQKPEFHDVEGTVTLDGVPLEGATVTFRPVGEGGMISAGLTDASGRYRLNPLRGPTGAGAKLGSYVVTVKKQQFPPVPLDADGNPVPPKTPPSPKWLTPQRYAEANTSGLEVTVREGKNTGPEVSFDLKADPSAK